MPNGTVKFFDSKKGYGFITTPEGQDVFVHYKDILADGFKFLEQGQAVEFQVYQSPKGARASDVREMSQQLD